MSIDFIFLTKRKIKTVSQGEIEKNHKGEIQKIPAKKYISIQGGVELRKP
jgi:hypothetical protein